MIWRLIRAEVTRLVHRRRALWSIIGIVAMASVAPLLWMEGARPLSALEVAEARRVMAEVGDECIGCTIADYTRYVWTLRDVLDMGVMPFTYLLAAIVLLIVIVYAGSDFSSGVISTQLTFTPRRSAVVASRTVILALYGALLMLLGMLSTSIVSLIWFIAMRGYGDFGDMTPLLQLWLWGSLCGLLFGAAGNLLVMLANGSTGAAAGLVGILLVCMMLEALGVQVVPRWMFFLSPTRQMDALLNGESSFYNMQGDLVYQILQPQALVYFSVTLALLAAAALLSFQRRDIKF